MALFIDRKYVNLVSSKLDRFVQKKQDLWNFRCPLCGDSKKNQLKSRGFFYVRKNSVFFRCHNCSRSLSMGSFLKEMDTQLFAEYRMDYYKEGKHSNVPAPDISVENKCIKVTIGVMNIPCVIDLPVEHIARKYVQERKIPQTQWNRLYYSSDFKKFVQETFPDGKTKEELEKWKDNDSRLVIPFYDENKKLIGAQGRALDDSKVRYITVKAFENAKKLYGLEKVDFTKQVYVVEGPLDSLFLDNSLATMDSSLESIYSIIGNHNYVFVYDNQPRHKEVVKLMNKSVVKEHNVCIWPSWIQEKDINDMVLAGNTPSVVQHIINTHTYSGLRAKLEFEKWRKV